MVIIVCKIIKLHLRHIHPSAIQPKLPINKNQILIGYMLKLVRATPANNTTVQAHSNQNILGLLTMNFNIIMFLKSLGIVVIINHWLSLDIQTGVQQHGTACVFKPTF